MPAIDDIDPIQDRKHAREAIPTRPPSVTDLHRAWMHARLSHERAVREATLAREHEAETQKVVQAAGDALAAVLLADVVAGVASRSRKRLVAIAGEVLRVSEMGLVHPGEYLVEPLHVDLIPLD